MKKYKERGEKEVKKYKERGEREVKKDKRREAKCSEVKKDK